MRHLQNITMVVVAVVSGRVDRDSTRIGAAYYPCGMLCMYASIRALFPTIPLRVNHHVSLHLAEFFLRYGPAHGWWMFPFERIIGILQQVNTNFKIGTPSPC